ncbi:MAG TPA: hypothetical protein VL769_08985 [Acidimicrobiia bacterium]|nr:hypothetical protein [Acidimicrobiia bacterium]
MASPLFEGHDGHNGPVFSPDLPKNAKWGDIIPAFDFGPDEQYAGKNLTTAGQAILDNGCVLPGTTTTSASTTTGPPNVTTPSSEATTTSTSVGQVVTDFGNPNPPVRPQGTPGDPPGTVTGSPTLALTGSPAAALLGIGLMLVASGIGLAVRRRNWAR